MLLAVVVAGCKAHDPRAGTTIDAPLGSEALRVDAAADGPAAAITCNGSDPMVAMPDGPHGIFAYQPTAEDLPYLTTNPVICGGNYLLSWKAIDNGSGTYDWTTADAAIAAWSPYGKKTNLLFVADDFAKPNNGGTPPYVTKAIASGGLGVPTVDCYDSTAKTGQDGVPEFWQPAFVQAYEAFIEAALVKYGSDPNVGYIRFGMSNGAQTGTTVCYAELTTAGMTETIWKAYVSELATYEAGRPHTNPVMLGLGPYNPDDTAPSFLEFPDWEATLAASLGLGIGNQGLSRTDKPNYTAGKACKGGDWCANFDRYYGVVPLYLQQIGNSCPDDSCLTGSLDEILPFAVTRHTQILEVYDSDLSIAYNPTNPAYGSAESLDYQALFPSLAVTLGTAP